LEKAETSGQYLENKTLENISKEIYDTIIDLPISIDEAKQICEKLTEYRLIDEIFKLHRGKFIRWIRYENANKPPTLTRGGLVVDIKFTDNGITIICKNMLNKCMQIRFDDCIIFQKITNDEMLVLQAISL
jgi:hypothetical protein